jgi:NitT/TauT family transport system substrate-binding protein
MHTMRNIIIQEPFRALFYAPYYAAIAREAYAAEGVDVRVLPGEVPSLAKDSVLSGAAHLAWGGPMRILLAHDADATCPLRNFGAVVLGDPFLLVGREPRPGFSLKDLAHLTLGTVAEVPTPWWALQEDVRQAGVDPTRVKRVTDQSMGENAAAVAAGTLEVAQLFEPLVSQMEMAGTGHVWHACAARGPTSYTTFYSTAENIAGFAPEFMAMIRGIAATQRWFHAASAEEITDCIKSFFPNLDAAVMARAITRYKGLGIWTQTPNFPPEPFNRLEAHMLSAGAIQRAPGYAACVDENITRRALELNLG